MPGCSDDDDKTTSPTPVDEFEVVRLALDDYLSAGDAPTIAAVDVFDAINGGTDPFIISVRSAEHYAIGHVPGAINVPWRAIADPANLTGIPDDEDLYVYCYTGHTGGVATTVLNALGYRAMNMKFGIMSWTQDETIRASTPFDETQCVDAAVEVDVHDPAETYALPTFDNTSSNVTRSVILAAAEAYIATEAPVVTAQDVFDIINEAGWEDDYIILSVRSATHYAIGHVPGAVNIPWREIAKVENLRKLDPEKRIIVYCYTGHTGGVATTALQMLGYDAVNMKHGIMAWTTDEDVRVISPFTEANDANDFPTEP
jgi:rhodanese-related sulfurtransferase